jgi:hypothetical protein
LGAIPDANQALERVLEISTDFDVRGQATLCRGALAVAVGETVRGPALLDGALDEIDAPAYRAEGYLWRARAFFQGGMVEQGWRDLDRAGEAHSSQFVPAGFERVVWGLVLPDLSRIHQGIQALIRTSRTQIYSDSIGSLVRRFADRWGPGSAAILMDNAEGAPWSRDVLAARRLSAALFQAYATAVPDAPWSGKALLTSKELTSDPAQRKWLDQRIDALPEDAYVRYARSGHFGPELGDLESRLQDTLDQLLERVDEELSARRQLAGVPKK